MRFLYPVGLLGLIGVPILIIIYIIKNKYTEQTVSSTYLWKLSEKFLKKKKKPPKIAGLLSLILQIVAVVAISFAIAHPVLIFPDAAYEYCFVIDASGSMNMERNGKTRFAMGKERVQSIIEDSADGSLYTIIQATDEGTLVVCDKSDEKSYALQVLNGLAPSFGETQLTDSLELTQSYFTANNTLRAYVITDKYCEKHDNIEWISVADDEWNYSIVNVLPEIVENGVKVDVKVKSSHENVDLTVKLYVDGNAEAIASNTVSVPESDVEVSVPSFIVEVETYRSLRVEIANGDSLSSDNEYVLYNVKSENSYKTLLVSKTPRFLQSVVEVISGAKVDTLDATEYATALSEKSGEPLNGYGLYIFDSISPQILPTDGTVWLFNQSENIEGAEFSVKRQVELQDGVELEMSKSSSTLTRQLLTPEMSGKQWYVYKYMRYGLYGNFTTLYSYQGEPMIFTGENAYGNREVVFSFSLHDSNAPMLGDFVIFMNNLLKFSFPAVAEKVTYNCGEKIELNLPPLCEAIQIIAPSGATSYPASGVEANEYVLSEQGVYTIALTVKGETKEYHVFAGIPQAESQVSDYETDCSLQGEKGNGGLDGKYDDLIVIFILLGLVFLVDWGVYCYDKYQLR